MIQLNNRTSTTELKQRILSDKEKVFLDLIAQIIVNNLTLDNEKSSSLCSN